MYKEGKNNAVAVVQLSNPPPKDIQQETGTGKIFPIFPSFCLNAHCMYNSKVFLFFLTTNFFFLLASFI